MLEVNTKPVKPGDVVYLVGGAVLEIACWEGEGSTEYVVVANGETWFYPKHGWKLCRDPETALQVVGANIQTAIAAVNQTAVEAKVEYHHILSQCEVNKTLYLNLLETYSNLLNQEEVDIQEP